MKSNIYLVTIAIALFATPVASFAQQSATPLTRAQVREELVEVEQAGYRPIGNDPDYPVDIQAAEAKVATMHAMEKDARSGFGSPTTGSSNCGASN